MSGRFQTFLRAREMRGWAIFVLLLNFLGDGLLVSLLMLLSPATMWPIILNGNDDMVQIYRGYHIWTTYQWILVLHCIAYLGSIGAYICQGLPVVCGHLLIRTSTLLLFFPVFALTSSD
jgi:hypothetical protein